MVECTAAPVAIRRDPNDETKYKRPRDAHVRPEGRLDTLVFPDGRLLPASRILGPASQRKRNPLPILPTPPGVQADQKSRSSLAPEGNGENWKRLLVVVRGHLEERWRDGNDSFLSGDVHIEDISRSASNFQVERRTFVDR